MRDQSSLLRFPDDLEEVLLQFDATWKVRRSDEFKALCPVGASLDFQLEMVRIDARKRAACGQSVEEAYYLEAFPELGLQPGLLIRLRQLIFVPPVGDSVLRALGANTPQLSQVQLPVSQTEVKATTPSPLPEHRYRFDGEIARGGMGAVLRGRDEDLGREIAVKVMLQNHAGKTELLQRFIEEAQIAGQLQHPGITPVYELGRFPDQRPYFTMKLVRGETLAQLLQNRSDPASERPRFLKVFEQICQTIAYAHTRQVIHRDLKPHNIMVGGFGEVQVMDWGLAKVLTRTEVSSATSPTRPDVPEVSEGSVQTKRSSGNSTDIPNTQAGSILGTPAYMAPEQARGDVNQLDERADVFGLGAILCEILTGKPPYVGRDGMDIYRQAVDADLTDAHTRLQTCEADPELISLAQRCLAAQREERPRNASELTNELTGYLHSVEARLKQAELSAVQAKTKAEEECKRRRVTFRLAAAILLTLLAGLGASLWQMNRAMTAEELAKENEGKANRAREAERERAEGERLAKLDALNKEKLARAAEVAERKARLEEERQREFSQAIADFVKNDFLALTSVEGQLRFGGDTYETLDKNTTLKQLLERAAEKLKARQNLDPLIEAELSWMIGVNFRGVGDANQGVTFLTRAVELRKRILGSDHATTLSAMNSLAIAYIDAGKADFSVPLLEALVKLKRAKFSNDIQDMLHAMNNLAGAYVVVGKLDLALPLLEEIVGVSKSKLGNDHPMTLCSMNNLAAAYRESGKLELALPLVQESLKLHRAKYGADHLDTLNSMNSLATTYQSIGKFHLAIPISVELVKLAKAKLGVDHPTTLNYMHSMAKGYQDAKQIGLALPLYEETLKQMKAKLGHAHPRVLGCMSGFGMCLRDAGKLDAAILTSEEVLKLRKSTLGNDHIETFESMNNLAVCYLDANKQNLALPLLVEAVKHFQTRRGKDHPSTLVSMNSLAIAYQKSGRADLARPIAEESYRLQKIKLGIEHPSTQIGLVTLFNIYQSTGKVDLMVPLLEELLKLKQVQLGKDHTEVLGLMNYLAKCYQDVGKRDQSLQMFETTLKARKAKLGDTHPDTIDSIGNLGKAYCDANQGSLGASTLKDFIAARRKQSSSADPSFATLLTRVAANLLKCNQHAAAEEMLCESFSIYKKTQPDVWTTFNTQSLLGAALLGQQKYAEAEPLLLQGYEGMKVREKTITPQAKDRIPAAIDRLIVLYTATNKPEDVKKWQAEKAKYPANPPATDIKK